MVVKYFRLAFVPELSGNSACGAGQVGDLPHKAA